MTTDFGKVGYWNGKENFKVQLDALPLTQLIKVAGDDFDPRLLADKNHLPWDTATETLLRIWRIALRGAIDNVGPLSNPSTQFFWVMGSRGGIGWKTAVWMLASECPELLLMLLPGLQETAEEAKRLMPKIHELRMPGQAKAWVHGTYERHIHLAELVSSIVPTPKGKAVENVPC